MNIKYASHKTNKILQKIGEIYLMKHLGKVDEVAKIVLFLFSDDSFYIASSELVIDGGVIPGA